VGSELGGDRERIAAALPGYEILRQLGTGSFGHVWAGRHYQLRRVDAIKSLKHFLVDDPTIRERFRREARVLANIEHPHIVPI
jgi:serine/threonine protein kinase